MAIIWLDRSGQWSTYVQTDAALKALTHRVIATGGNVVDKGLSVKKAKTARGDFDRKGVNDIANICK